MPLKDKTARSAWSRQNYLANREQRLARICLRAQAPETVVRKRDSDAKRYALNSVVRRKSAAVWKRAHPGKVNAANTRRRAAKIRRTPAWADLGKIDAFYDQANGMKTQFGGEWHVDHVIPLCGKKVSGLHVHENLQILQGCENVKKSNRYEL